jgi:hypothetical protein
MGFICAYFSLGDDGMVVGCGGEDVEKPAVEAEAEADADADADDTGAPIVPVIDNDDSSSDLGSVSGAGDVNGDGFSDIIVGAPGVHGTSSAGFSRIGRTYLILGGL